MSGPPHHTKRPELDTQLRSSSLPTTLTSPSKCKQDATGDERVAKGFSGHHINGSGPGSTHIDRRRSSSTAMTPVSTSPRRTVLSPPHRPNVQLASYPPATRSKVKDLNATRMPPTPSPAALAASTKIGPKPLTIPQPTRARPPSVRAARAPLTERLSPQDPGPVVEPQRLGRAPPLSSGRRSDLNPTPPLPLESVSSATLRADTTDSETLVDADTESVDDVRDDAFGIAVGPEQQERELAWVGAQFP